MLPERIDWRHVLVVLVILLAFAILAVSLPALYTEMNPSVGRVAIIQLNGPIMGDTDVRTQGVTPNNIASLTQNAKNDRADAIIYEINSPGGSAVASKDAARVVKEVDVPTICLLRETAASGAYWVASACDHVIADSLTITGSIGVTSAYLEFSELLNRFGVDYVNLTSGEYKDMGSRYRNITDEERAKFQDILDTVHLTFVESVAENRDMTTEQVETVATGEIFLGVEAQRLGLVDTLGSKQDAISVAKNMTGTETLKEKEYAPPRRIDLFSLFFTKIGEGIVDGLRGEQRYGIEARYR